MQKFSSKVSLALALAISICTPQIAVAQQKELTFAGWGGKPQEAISKAFLAPFAKETGIAVKEDFFDGSYAKVQAMVESGNVTWDLMQVDAYYPLGICGKYAEKLDFSKIDRTKLPKEMVSDCAVPIFQHADLMMYSTEFDANPPTGWADYFDTEKFPGKRAAYAGAFGGLLEGALLADGVPPKELYPLDYDRAFKKLDTLGSNLIFYSTGAQQQEMMERGDAAFYMAWSGRAFNAMKNNAKVAPVWNQALALYDVLMIPKGAKNKDVAEELIAYAVGAGPQARLSQYIAYGPVNSEARPQVDKLTETLLSTTPGNNGNLVLVNAAWWGENQAEADRRFTDWVSSR